MQTAAAVAVDALQIELAAERKLTEEARAKAMNMNDRCMQFEDKLRISIADAEESRRILEASIAARQETETAMKILTEAGAAATAELVTLRCKILLFESVGCVSAEEATNNLLELRREVVSLSWIPFFPLFALNCLILLCMWALFTDLA